MSAPVEYAVEGRPDGPVVWLDTHAISQLASAVGRDGDDAKRVAIRERLVEQRRSGAVFSFESDQMVEIEVTPQRVDACGRLLSHISLGAVTSYRTVRRAQRRIGMSAMFDAGSVSVPWTSAFQTDPMNDAASNDLIVRVDLAPSAALLEMQRASNRHTADQWELIRQDNLRRPGSRDANRVAQLDAELGAMEQLAVRLSQEVSIDKLLTDPNLNAVVAEALALPLVDLRSLGGADLELPDLLDFYASQYYRDLPSVRIEAELMARLVTGNEVITPSDVMDVHNIGAFLPYSTDLVIDRAKIAAVRELGLDERYGARVLRLLELDTILQ